MPPIKGWGYIIFTILIVSLASTNRITAFTRSYNELLFTPKLQVSYVLTFFITESVFFNTKVISKFTQGKCNYTLLNRMLVAFKRVSWGKTLDCSATIFSQNSESRSYPIVEYASPENWWKELCFQRTLPCKALLWKSFWFGTFLASSQKILQQETLPTSWTLHVSCRENPSFWKYLRGCQENSSWVLYQGISTCLWQIHGLR